MFPGRARYQRAATAGAITALAITIGLGVLAMLAARVNKSPSLSCPVSDTALDRLLRFPDGGQHQLYPAGQAR